MPTENRNLRFLCSSLSHNNFHIETFLFFFVIFNDKKSRQAGELSIYKQLCIVVISQKRHFQKKHKNNLLFKHFISSLQSCIRVKYISVGFKFTLENETSEIFGVILNHNSFHIDKALPCRGQIKEQLYILMRLAIPSGKFQDTTAYSYVYVFVLFWWFWRSIVFFIILTSTEKRFKHQKVQIFVMQNGYAMTMAIFTNTFFLPLVVWLLFTSM